MKTEPNNSHLLTVVSSQMYDLRRHSTTEHSHTIRKVLQAWFPYGNISLSSHTSTYSTTLQLRYHIYADENVRRVSKLRQSSMSGRTRLLLLCNGDTITSTAPQINDTKKKIDLFNRTVAPIHGHTVLFGCVFCADVNVRWVLGK